MTMDFLGLLLFVSGVIVFAATFHQPTARHRRSRCGLSFADLQARLEAEAQRTYLPLRGW
ncbi:hypothetical protein [Nocardia otitidiscaviarum]|uniref:hypothetical protein n=1 Tax=Nocardia otitidiscaviarum TaxID=1823 RepID=UPI0004A71CA4|nr:hypothetical protein [Nocardia otitidiscaviarum]